MEQYSNSRKYLQEIGLLKEWAPPSPPSVLPWDLGPDQSPLVKPAGLDTVWHQPNMGGHPGGGTTYGGKIVTVDGETFLWHYTIKDGEVIDERWEPIGPTWGMTPQEEDEYWDWRLYDVK